MNNYEKTLLIFLKNGPAGLEEIQKELKIASESALSLIESLYTRKAIEVSREKVGGAELTEEGKRYLDSFPEEEFIEKIKKAGGSAPISGKEGVALIWAKKNGWITITNGKVILTPLGNNFLSGKRDYQQRALLNKISARKETSGSTDEVLRALLTRNLVVTKEKSIISEVRITKEGLSLLEAGASGAADLTREMLTKGTWKDVDFRKYDIKVDVESYYPARLHPVKEFISYIRNVWVGMGFVETIGPVVDSAFWNFDALFSPQDHPTRDMQDTFFLSNPKMIDIENVALLEKVKKMHIKGWGEVWRKEIASQPVLRPHVTNVSAHNIQRLANAVENSPLKLFSIGKVFRNESIDYKHLAELHQYEGIIIGKKLGMSNLIYTLKEFYSNIGFETDKKRLIIKPSYFPFVEPGLEVSYVVDEEKGTTIELAGAGVIRKEITKALGTKNTVLAWGGGLDRLMFNLLDIKLLTELYDNNIGWLRRRGNLKI